ncbi:hypothetical protein ElyMa_000125700 [Elysia marginata]|uniref:GPI mannosyltransferase 2 n=1 Tax=Elysia marginata TaxID=1093978 RepID=A0AAV4EPV4_9GAST|nr:hypothetical protein ElyMa_000125700 [Elysia marginata]
MIAIVLFMSEGSSSLTGLSPFKRPKEARMGERELGLRNSSLKPHDIVCHSISLLLPVVIYSEKHGRHVSSGQITQHASAGLAAGNRRARREFVYSGSLAVFWSVSLCNQIAVLLCLVGVFLHIAPSLWLAWLWPVYLSLNGPTAFTIGRAGG